MTTAPNSRDLRTTRPSPRTHKRLTNPQKYFGNQFCSIQFTSTCFCVKCISSNQFEIKHPLNNQPRTNHSSLNNHKPHFQNFFLLDQPPTLAPHPTHHLLNNHNPLPELLCPQPPLPLQQQNAPPGFSLPKISPKSISWKTNLTLVTRTLLWCEW